MIQVETWSSHGVLIDEHLRSCPFSSAVHLGRLTSGSAPTAHSARSRTAVARSAEAAAETKPVKKDGPSEARDATSNKKIRSY